MRTMQIDPLGEVPTGFDSLGPLLRSRLVDNVARWPAQSSRLISYMAWPNDEMARNCWTRLYGISATSVTAISDEISEKAGQQAGLETSGTGGEHWATSATLDDFYSRLKLIQQHWARTADILHHHYDLAQGGHQARRGGPSLGKAIELIAASATTKGTGKSKLWEIWKTHKDVAHVVTAAVLIAAEANYRNGTEAWGLSTRRFQPVTVTDMLPDLVLSVAVTLEKYGLEVPVHGREGPLFDPSTLWRIPANIGISAISPPARRITGPYKTILGARRAGHRGRRKPDPKATPVSN